MNRPKVELTPLPIDAYGKSICELITKYATTILKAAPGTGKTTRVPRMIAKCNLSNGTIIVLEPRRLAARLSAERVAAEAGQTVGDFSGYQIRYDKKFTSKTKIIFVTEGIFIRWLMENPRLEGIGCIILDEFHERNLQTDMALAFVMNCQKKWRSDLKLVVMSATLDTAKLEKHIGACGVLDIPGKNFPISIEYSAPEAKQSIEDACANAAVRLLEDPRCNGNILVFQSGAGSIQRTVRQIQNNPHVKAKAIVLPLYSSLSNHDQKKVFEISDKIKIVVATNVAETSLTLPNITGVVDNGMAKISGHTPWSGMPTLEEKRISQASAIQRAGRAGRTAPGVVIRAYKEAEYLRSEAFSLPDIKRVDLTTALLQVLAAAEASNTDKDIDIFSSLPWFELPDDKSINTAYELLKRLGCIDKEKRLTLRGRSVSQLPLHPRLGAILESAKGKDDFGDVICAVSIISEKLFADRRERAREHSQSDIALRLDQIKAQHFNLDWQEHEWAKPIAMTKLAPCIKLMSQLAALYGIPGLTKERTNIQAVATALLTGYGDRVAKIRAPASKRAQKQLANKQMLSFCLGRGGQVAECSTVEKVDWVIVIDATERLKVSDSAKATVAWQCVGISTQDLISDPMQLVKQQIQTEVDGTRGIIALEKRYYGQLLLEEKRVEIKAKAAQGFILDFLVKNWPSPFPNDKDLQTYHLKLDLLDKANIPHSLPRFDGEFMTILLESIAENKTTFEAILERNLSSYINDQLNWDEQQILLQLPDKLKLDNGKKFSVTYTEDGATITGLIQEFFGIKQPPMIVSGRIPIKYVFIGPNKRPAQITTDWQGFWNKTYGELKSELSRKYPRHHWAEDPKSAPPVITMRQLQRL